jgi:hypothetical protein
MQKEATISEESYIQFSGRGLSIYIVALSDLWAVCMEVVVAGARILEPCRGPVQMLV